MGFERLLLIAVGILVSIGVVKFSAQLAYKRPVPWTEAFIQWILLIVLALIAGLVLDSLEFGVELSEFLSVFG